VLYFTLDDKAVKELKFQTKMTYTNVADRQAKTIVNENLLLGVKSIDAYLTHFNKGVAEQVVLYAANENMENAMLEADKGNYEAARRYTDANGYFFRSNAAYVKGSIELQKMESVNRMYAADLLRAKAMGTDSLKLMQKTQRVLNYQIRSKKQ